MNLINKGDTVYIGHGGQVCKFEVQRVDADHVWLLYHVENVAHIKRVPKFKVLQLMCGKAA
jgi:hypothetical protein